VAWPGVVCAVLVYLLRMVAAVTSPSGRQPGLLRGRRGLRARKSGQVGGHRSRSAGQARTASVSVRGRARKASGVYGRIADRAGHSCDR
jgi:hypothetical protein